jgi:uncharacterized protein
MSQILESWKQGLGFPDTLVIDGHIHIGGWPHAATFQDLDEAERESLAFLDANGVDAFVSVGGGQLHAGRDYHLGNDFLLALWQRLPGRMIPFLSLNPNDTRDNVLAEMDRMFDAGVRGIKLINWYQEKYPGDGSNLMAVYQYAADRNMLVFNHQWEKDVIWAISAKFPTVDFIFGHYGPWQDTILKERANVHANIWSVGSVGWLDRAFVNIGAHKFMFGSDGFLNPLSVGIGPVVYSPISDDDKRGILGLNVARLLDGVGALPDAIKDKYREQIEP